MGLRNERKAFRRPEETVRRHLPGDARRGERHLTNLEPVPDLCRARYELAGFIWFQGWNDMISAEYTAEYATNIMHFIRDVRQDLKAPNLPLSSAKWGRWPQRRASIAGSSKPKRMSSRTLPLM